MTLPEFAYPDQHRYGIPDYANRLAGRILKDLCTNPLPGDEEIELLNKYGGLE